MNGKPPPTPDCGCCEGVDAATPRRLDNPPGASQISYRIGRHGDFLESIRSRLSSAERPALGALTTREASDFTLAIGDALACSLDVLSFYTERYANEHYLRTATERLSVREMARLIGYRLAPGVAASTHLAFTLQAQPGVPAEPIEIPVGTRVQSVPGQDEQAQTFETVTAVAARAEWNAIPVQQDSARLPAFGDTELWLAGIDSGLEVGDRLLIVGTEQEQDPSAERWDLRVLSGVTTYPDRNLTRVRWLEGLGHTRPFVLPAGEGVRVYTFRARTAAFGANAPDWRALSDDAKAAYMGVADPDSVTTWPDEWPEFTVLAPVYPERRSGDGVFTDTHIPATIEQVAAAATSAAQAAAVQALHGAAAAGTGVVAAGNRMAIDAINAARDATQAMGQVAQLAADEVTGRVQAMLGAVQDAGDQSITEIIGGLVASLPGVAGDAVADTPSMVVDAADLLNPAPALETLGDNAAQMGARARDAAVATLGAAAAADVAALVGSAVTIARGLPAPLAPTTPEGLAAVARHFAALGVVRAGGTPPLAPTASEAHAQIEARLPSALQGAFEIGEQLLSLADEGQTLANAPRNGALAAFEQIVAQVDQALLGSFTTLASGLNPLVRSPDTIDISPVNDAVVTGGWALLSVPNSVELYRISSATTASRAEYLLSGQTTRLRLSGELPGGRLPAEFEHAVRSLSVHVESEELTLAHTPLEAPVYGEEIALDHRVEGLLPGQPVALRGRLQPVMIARGSKDLPWTADSGEHRLLAEGDRLLLAAAPARLVGSTEHYLAPAAFAAAIGDHGVRLRLLLEDRDGQTGRVDLRGSDITLAAVEDADPEVAEVLLLVETGDAITHDRDRSHLRLAAATRHCYARRSARVNANVAPATHGERVEAILGSGDGSRPNQRFTLNQEPLTHVSAKTPSGGSSTLEVRINDVLWSEVSTLYQATPNARLYQTSQDDDGLTTIQFGDGIEGARLPSGESNVRVRYRKGLGVAGNVGAGKLTTLLSRPLGVSEVSNPEAATGGEDGETLARARSNAPLTVLTLDRAVSITDYANFARAFAGIDKAHALWLPAGPAQGVFLTIAGVDGAEVPESSETFSNLSDALRSYGDPLVPLRIRNHSDARFRCRLSIKVLGDYQTDPVLAAVDQVLRAHFAFAKRDFGQTVSVDEVAAVAQAVAGVAAVHVTRLHRVGEPATVVPRLFATLPVTTLTGMPKAAELLTLADGPVELEVLP